MQVLARRPDLMRVAVDTELYSESVVFKCCYWYGADYEVDITRTSNRSSYQIDLRPKKTSMTEEQLIALESRIRQDLLDFKTREIVATETAAIRQLLVAKAFASSDDFDQQPPGQVTDPVGFKPENLFEDRSEI